MCRLCNLLCRVATFTLISAVIGIVVVSIKLPLLSNCEKNSTEVYYTSEDRTYFLYKCDNGTIADNAIVGSTTSSHNDFFMALMVWLITDALWAAAALLLLVASYISLSNSCVIAILYIPWMLMTLIIIAINLAFICLIGIRYTDVKNHSSYFLQLLGFFHNEPFKKRIVEKHGPIFYNATSSKLYQIFIKLIILVFAIFAFVQILRQFISKMISAARGEENDDD